jgi:hypothetical protein
MDFIIHLLVEFRAIPVMPEVYAEALLTAQTENCSFSAHCGVKKLT